MSRLLIVPAGGVGSRLKAAGAKVLAPVAGRPMLDYLIDLYERYVDRVVVVANPAFSMDVQRHLDRRLPGRFDVVEQASPTGMLDAILLAGPVVVRERPDTVWITWCDQVGVLSPTVKRLADLDAGSRRHGLVFPTVRRRDPYIHFARDTGGRIIEVRERREGDTMPPEGESDMGLFSLSRDAFERALPSFAQSVPAGRGTGERNFLPFIPWLAAIDSVVSFPCTDPMEAVGINTPEDLRLVEAWLRERSADVP